MVWEAAGVEREAPRDQQVPDHASIEPASDRKPIDHIHMYIGVHIKYSEYSVSMLFLSKRYCMAVLIRVLIVRLSVCLSVRPSEP